MLQFNQFFQACSGFWQIERTYHDLLSGGIERSYTEYKVDPLAEDQKQEMLSLSPLSTNLKVGNDIQASQPTSGEFPGFNIAFDTISEKGEQLSMNLKALFVPYDYVQDYDLFTNKEIPPVAAQLPITEEVVQGFYLRDEGYSESGAIQSSFTYLPSRQTLEMLTFYRRSIAIDQMRLVSDGLRLRTIITYQKPEPGEIPSVISLVGFGVEKRKSQ
jgi:hypothetical protein